MCWVLVNGTKIFEVKQADYDSSIPILDIEAQEDGVVKVYVRAKAGEKVSVYLLDETKSQFDNIFEELSLINDETDILSLYPQYEIVPVLANFQKTNDAASHSYGVDNFVIMWFSDLHSETEVLKRYVKFEKEYSSYIDEILCSGDVVNRHEDDFSYWQGLDASKYLMCIGNHEVLSDVKPTVDDKTVSSPYYSSKHCYEKYLQPYLTETNITIETNRSYWYKDYPTQKIRIIALDYLHWNDTPKLSDGTYITTYPDGGGIDDGAQQTWLTGVLNDAIANDLNVIITLHAPLRMGVVFENTFSAFFVPDVNTGLFAGWAELAGIVDTFINNGGKFVTYLCGHRHEDLMGSVENYPNQLVRLIDTSRISIRSGDIAKVWNTRSEDLFEIICVNTNLKYLTFYRIGSNTDRIGRHIGSIVFDYDNMRLIHQN